MIPRHEAVARSEEYRVSGRDLRVLLEAALEVLVCELAESGSESVELARVVDRWQAELASREWGEEVPR